MGMGHKKDRIGELNSFWLCINTCRFPWEMFEHSAYWPRVQTASSGLASNNARKKNV